MKRAPHLLFLALVAADITQAVWQHARLPERVASHFNAAGQANGWMSHDYQTAWHIGVVLFMAALFEGIAWIAPRVPKELINLPHRDYWLAPERLAATQGRLGSVTWLLGSLLMAFFFVLFHLVYRANLEATPLATTELGLCSVGLLAAMGFVLAAMILHFARPPA